MRGTAGDARIGWDGLFPWLIAVLVAQAAVVIAGGHALVAGLSPPGIAQGTLLQDIYGLSNRSITLGWVGFWRGLPAGGGQPTAATLVASLVEVYGGGGRFALLLPGLALLLASELAFAAAALRLTRSPGLAALGLGLLLLRTRPWLAETGLFTVNTAWPAFCCFGLAVSLMIAPPARHRGARSLLCAALGLATLCLSIPAFACLLIVAALRIAIGLDVSLPRFAGALAPPALAAVAVALLWAADACPPVRTTGIRLDQDMVARCGYGLRTSLLYLGSFDLGLAYIVAAALSLGTALGLLVLRREHGTEPRMDRRSGAEAVFLAAVLVALACIQVARRSADPIGSGLIDVPLTALLLIALAALARRFGGRTRRSGRLAGFGFLALSAVLPSVFPLLDAPRTDSRERPAVSAAASWLVRDAEANARPSARILLASLSPIMDGPGLSALFYETFGEPATFTVTNRLADGADLSGLDYAILPAGGLASPTEIDLRQRLDSTMIRRAHLDQQGLDLVVYSAPVISVSGVSGDWLLAAGTSLRFVTGEIPEGSVIALRGLDGYARFIPEPPSVTAVAAARDGATVTLPARFVREGNTYAIFVDPGPVAALGVGRTEVALDFGSFFVPKEVGINQDPRRLAVMAPTTVGLAPRAAAFDAAGPAP